MIVMGIFTLLGAMIGVDISLWPWDSPVSMTFTVCVGTGLGFFLGVAVVWTVRQTEDLN